MLSLQRAVGLALKWVGCDARQSEEVGRIGRVAMPALKEIGLREQDGPFEEPYTFQLPEMLSLSCNHASLSLQGAFLGS